ncbi:pentatricopeptide repeat-containing protein At1g59720, chloroplastic/mitochondrial [Spinacia oleracea]|uniref:Pentatricopeptide repeat-containing protein At1g59720, chloroplastic/mitochondrial n=1 Tax=Spinacia oleracea TaxID=3562 RepID=A0ABM3RW61_SPIOL|nr:pentatricopeptide repeat-containing protein At1g59720, chloroplastic/mitochondrial [Spinacia oleracea]
MLIASTTIPPPYPLSSSAPPTTTNHHAHHLLSLLNQCSSMTELKQIHAQTLRTTPTHHPKHLHFLYSRILHFTSSTNIHYSLKIFSQIQDPNSFIWNTLIRACASSNSHKKLAFQLYHDMLNEGFVIPDKHTFPFVLKACAYLFDEFAGKQAHAHAVKLGFGSDVYVNNSLIHFYASCGYLDCAQKVFDEMPERSVVSWNAIIDALVRSREFDTALRLFREMQGWFEPDGYTLQSIISACAGLGALSLGVWAHAYVLRVRDGKLGTDVLMNNSLVEMYCKCGMLDLAKQVFNRMVKHDVNSYNNMILGLAMHGKSELALKHFEDMTNGEGLKPNAITFVGVLSACNHGGMVEIGRKYFDKMVRDYSIEPRVEHYGCLVDLLARAGLIEEALDIVSNMHMKPDVVIWRSILDACCKKNVGIQLSEQVFEKILESEGVTSTTSSGVYVLLSRIYASASKWNEVGLIRKLMSDKGARKEPGCSSMEIDGVHHEFFAGDTSHSQTKDIYRVLDVINERLHSVGYKPDISQAPLVDDEDEDQKQHALKLHSERLAIAFGLLNQKPGVPIRIFKNLRVCNDCHEVTKLISDIFDVEIVVRDRARFHHFKDGSCSCADYW